MNSFFCNVGKCLAEKIAPKPNPLLNGELGDPPSCEPFMFSPINEETLIRVCGGIKTSNGSGVDCTPSFFLKIGISVLALSLVQLFNLSLSLGRFPDSCKIARVAPIFKDEATDDKSIFLLQSAFRKLHSVLTCLLKSSNDWYLNIDKGRYYKFSEGIECISFEINLRKKKWMLFSVYRPPTQSQDYLFENLGRALDHYGDNYENFMFIGDFNMTETEEQMKNFLDLYSLKNLMHEPTCYKSQTARCIDLVLTYRNRSVQQTTTVETGLSDFHKMVVTVLKTTFPKQGPTVINYRNYKNFTETVLEMTFERN